MFILEIQMAAVWTLVTFFKLFKLFENGSTHSGYKYSQSKTLQILNVTIIFNDNIMLGRAFLAIGKLKL